eukprot:TRINITY_DN14853_c0_g2_i2.p1 TRINITY_DN14853_c0_g2~~TRINITY_DN14853_c0_g2_i2.p1  ORF type:complete len:145 (-),score=22.80 TRINITY_DN14853_c0_g2_i2:21-455(-)
MCIRDRCTVKENYSKGSIGCTMKRLSTTFGFSSPVKLKPQFTWTRPRTSCSKRVNNVAPQQNQYAFQNVADACRELKLHGPQTENAEQYWEEHKGSLKETAENYESKMTLALGKKPFNGTVYGLSLIHICRCRRIERCRSRWSP